ncbi:MAG: hypothetical protein GY783_17380 [Gammaproteobacteria bacterium]|nr:hypothetical protein [Gammaproteobacteria bacterium]
MFALFETLFDIIRLRKGPDAIPHSVVLLVVIVALWLFAGLVMTLMTAELDEKDFFIGTLTGMAGLSCYAAIVVLSGKRARLLQAVMALLGCGALLSLLFVAGNVFLSPFLSENITKLIVTLILLWTVPVEGHIISRTIDRHWYVGVVAAVAVFVFQLLLYSVMDPAKISPT